MDDEQTNAAPSDLVFAVCHEVGNLLAATGLEAHLLGHVAGENVAAAARTFSGAALRGGSLLALVRPLLAPATVDAHRLDPAAILERLAEGVEPAEREWLTVESIDPADPDRPPHVRGDGELIHHLLLCEIRGKLGSPDEPVRVRAVSTADAVVFRVIHVGVGDPASEGVELVGRSLTRACASEILARLGGRLEVDRDGDATRVGFYLPAA